MTAVPSRIRSRCSSPGAQDPGTLAPANQVAPLNLVNATIFVTRYAAHHHNCIIIYGPDGGSISLDDYFYFPGRKTIEILRAAHPNWQFSDVLRILVDGKVIRPVTSDEIDDMNKNMNAQIEKFGKKNWDAMHPYQQIQTEQGLRRYMTRKWNKHMEFIPLCCYTFVSK